MIKTICPSCRVIIRIDDEIIAEMANKLRKPFATLEIVCPSCRWKSNPILYNGFFDKFTFIPPEMREITSIMKEILEEGDKE